MGQAIIEILGLVDGSPSPFDRQFLVEFDPDRPGVAPDGRPIIFHLVTTTDRFDRGGRLIRTAGSSRC